MRNQAAKSKKRKRTSATASQPAILVIDVTHEPSVTLPTLWDGETSLIPHVAHADSDESDDTPVESDANTFDSLQRFLLENPFDESRKTVSVQQQQPDERIVLDSIEPLDSFELVDRATGKPNPSFSLLQLPSFDTIYNDQISVNMTIKRLDDAYLQVTKHLTDIHYDFSRAMLTKRSIEKNVENSVASAETAGSTSSTHLRDTGQQQQQQHQSSAQTSTFSFARLSLPPGSELPSTQQPSTPAVELLRIGLKLLYQALTNTVLVEPIYSPATLNHAEDIFRPDLILHGQTDYGDLVKSHISGRSQDPAFASLPKRDQAFVDRYIFHAVTHQVYVWCLNLATRQDMTREIQVPSNRHFCGEAAFIRTQQVHMYLTRHANVRQFMHNYLQDCYLFANTQLLMLHVYFILIKLRYAVANFRQAYLVKAAAIGSFDTFVRITAVQMRQMLARICLQLDFTTSVRATYLRQLGSDWYMSIMKPIADIAPGILTLLDDSELEELQRQQQQQQQSYRHGQGQQLPAPHLPPYNVRSL